MIESVHFMLQLSASYTKAPPFFQVQHNNTTVVSSTTVNENTKVEFDIELPIDAKETHCLKIIRSGFDSLHEQYLRLENIQADGIDCKTIFYKSKFYPEYPEPWASEQKAQNIDLPLFYPAWVEWGWNGVWVLEFNTPFYTWLLESV